MNNIRQAVSLIIQYKTKVFIIKRQNYLNFFPGYIAFPGGKVDKNESLEIAAYREAKEELGVDIGELIENSTISSFEKIAHATTPEFNPYRFDTTFFLIKCNRRPKFVVDENEAATSEWVSPYDIVRKYNSGDCLIVRPIKVLLELMSEKKLSDFVDFDFDSPMAIPSIEPLKDVIQLMPHSNTLPPADRTNCFLLGDSIKMLVDPSPRDTEEYRNLINQLKTYSIDKVLITHHHDDHHQFSPEVAKHLGVPIYISSDSLKRIKQKKGNEYFRDTDIFEIKEGDKVGRWMGQSILAYEIPGHDEGHIGIAPEKLNWFVVGDLFQGVGTVVVGGEEGDMGKYFASLKKIITLAPKCVIPSHGIALGGTYILEKTLLHRMEREKQVLELFDKNPDIDFIVKTLYFDLPRALLPYAKANVLSHLNKLRDEGKLD